MAAVFVSPTSAARAMASRLAVAYQVREALRQRQRMRIPLHDVAGILRQRRPRGRRAYGSPRHPTKDDDAFRSQD